MEDALVKQVATETLDLLYTKLTRDGAFEHKSPSEGTLARFDSLEEKIDNLSRDLHDEVKTITDKIEKQEEKLTNKIDDKAPKSWLHWLWGIGMFLVAVITGFTGAQYAETKDLNKNITNILIEQATLRTQQDALIENQIDVESALNRVSDELRKLELTP